LAGRTSARFFVAERSRTVVGRRSAVGDFFPFRTPERVVAMQAIMDFLGNPWVMVGMGVVLLALIGLLIFLRTRPQDE
jgi:hypothetical protein